MEDVGRFSNSNPRGGGDAGVLRVEFPGPDVTLPEPESKGCTSPESAGQYERNL